jgi:hypothetical protein
MVTSRVISLPEQRCVVATAERVTKSIDDPIARLAVLLEQWRLRPARGARWLQDLCRALEQREPIAWARYQRVAALGVDIGALLDLPPWSRAAIRGSALLSAIAQATADPAASLRQRGADSRRWEARLRGWRWLTASAGVLNNLRPGFDDSRTLSRHVRQSPLESRVLALAEGFDDLKTGKGGAPRMRIPETLRALRAGNWGYHDPQLVDLLWSEAGQAVCHKLARSGGAPFETTVSELKAIVRLLEREQPNPILAVHYHTKDDKATSVAPPDPASAGEDEAGVQEDVEEREEMSLTTTKQERNADTSESRVAEASLPDQIGAAMREMEEIRAAATRGLEALASVAPALEDLSDLVFRLQASIQRVQDGGAGPRPVPGAADLRSVSLRIEWPGGQVDVAEVVRVLDTLSDLRDLRVRDQTASGAVLQARTDSNADMTVLEAKVAGLLARHLEGSGEDEAVKVTFLEAA